MLGESVGVGERSIGSLTFPGAVEEWKRLRPAAVNEFLGTQACSALVAWRGVASLAKVFFLPWGFSLFHHIIPIPGIYLEGGGKSRLVIYSPFIITFVLGLLGSRGGEGMVL